MALNMPLRLIPNPPNLNRYSLDVVDMSALIDIPLKIFDRAHSLATAGQVVNLGGGSSTYIS